MATMRRVDIPDFTAVGVSLWKGILPSMRFDEAEVSGGVARSVSTDVRAGQRGSVAGRTRVYTMVYSFAARIRRLNLAGEVCYLGHAKRSQPGVSQALGGERHL